MFLNELKEGNKENFLKLCVHAALANDVFEEEEKDAIYAYCREMNIEVHIPNNDESFDELLKNINATADNKEKKIIILEILALVKSDGVYDEQELEFMNKLTHGLDLPSTLLDKLNELLEKYIAVGQELFMAVSE